MAKQNAKITYQWFLLKIYVEDCICHGFKFFSLISFQLYHQALLIYEGIYFIKHRDIAT